MNCIRRSEIFIRILEETGFKKINIKRRTNINKCVNILILSPFCNYFAKLFFNNIAYCSQQKIKFFLIFILDGIFLTIRYFL